MTAPRVDFRLPGALVNESDATKGISLNKLIDIILGQGGTGGDLYRIQDARQAAREFNTQGSPSPAADILKSGLLDTLVQMIGGKPSVMRTRYELPANAMGSYVLHRSGGPDTLNLARSMVTEDTPDSLLTQQGKNPKYRAGAGFVLAHEMGHKLDNTSLNFMDPFAAKLHDWSKIYPGTAKSGTYSFSSPDEHFAEAYSTAVNLLRPFARMQKDDVNPELKKALTGLLNAHEERVPGTAAMLDAVLSSPVYKDYPLRSLFQKLARPAMNKAEATYMERERKLDSAALAEEKLRRAKP